MKTDNSRYADALTEIEEGRVDKGVWARAFAESEGNESRAKAAYIRARAEAVYGDRVWSDTKPSPDEMPSNSLDTPTTTNASTPEPSYFYSYSLGAKSQIYYLNKFKAFDKQEAGLHISWNWAAFLFGGLWALYRKMYGWFFVWWTVATAVTFLGKIPNPEISQWMSGAYLALAMGFAVFADTLYHRKINARIQDAIKLGSDALKVRTMLSSHAGVNTWVPYAFGSVPVLGIVLALILPTFQDKHTRQESTEIPPPVAVISDGGQSTPTMETLPSASNNSDSNSLPPSGLPVAGSQKPPTNQRLTEQQKQAAADLEEAAKRIVLDYPFLDTPQGEEALRKIIERRDELISNGTYPSLALQRAANAIAPAYAAKLH